MVIGVITVTDEGEEICTGDSSSTLYGGLEISMG